MRNKKEKILSVFLVLIVFVVGAYIISGTSNKWEGQVDKLTDEIASTQATILQKNIAYSISYAKVLGSYIRLNNGDTKEFNIFAKDMYESVDIITNLQLAPDGIIKNIYPLKGHEKALGHNILKVDDRKKEALIAKMSRELTLAGPFTLIQGGVAIIGRQPVFIKDKFWGFASALIYLDNLLKLTDLEKLKKSEYVYRLWRYHPDTKEVDVFAGQKEMNYLNMHTKTIDVPNSKWYLDVAYTGKVLPIDYIIVFYILNLITSLVCGYGLYIILLRSKELESMLIQQSKMAAIGEMFENIAHQWRQPLSAISTTSSGLKVQNELGIIKEQDLIEGFDSITRNAIYLSNTINDFRDFFDPNKEKATFKISETITKTLNIVSSKYKSMNIRVFEDIEQVEIYGYENELIQVLMNIFNNAKDALINVDENDRFIFVDIAKKDETLELKIKDSAGGIPEHIIKKIFEQYFTTKGKDGTGIGLYMSKRIIEKNMEGSLLVENKTYEYSNKAYKGAEFKIILPLS